MSILNIKQKWSNIWLHFELYKNASTEHLGMDRFSCVEGNQRIDLDGFSQFKSHIWLFILVGTVHVNKDRWKVLAEMS